MLASVRPRFVPAPCQDSTDSGRLILRDGSTAHIRRAHPEDREALARFFTDLSAESLYRRFQSASTPKADLIARFAADLNPKSAVTLAVTRFCGGGPRIVATGSYLARDAKTAEVALAV